MSKEQKTANQKRSQLEDNLLESWRVGVELKHEYDSLRAEKIPMELASQDL